MKQFVSSYQGSADYIVNGVKYAVRTFALPNGSHRPDLWPFVQAEVGTVHATHWPDMAEFPPADVMAEFPGYIGARVRQETGYQVECNGSAPQTFTNHLGWIEVKL